MAIKYTKEITEKLLQDYANNKSVKDLAQELDVPERSIIAKLSALGVYQKKIYTNKRGEVPIKKCDMIERIANLLQVHSEQLESLEKVNKGVLKLLELHLTQK